MNPDRESTTDQKVVESNWEPVPQHIDKSKGDEGGLKTSPCINFHPNLEILSAFSSSVIGKIASRRRLRTNIAQTIPKSTDVTTKLLQMENQCTLSGILLLIVT
jgi:hypothetical protein